MSGYVDHAWRHRPKALGGTDPIESAGASTMDYGFASVTADLIFDGTPTYDAADYMAWSSRTYRGSSFSNFTDGNGVTGIGCDVADAVIHGWVTCWIEPHDTATSNTGFLIPPKIRVKVMSLTDNTDDFGSSWLGMTETMGFVWHRPTEEAVPATGSDPSGLGRIDLGGMFALWNTLSDWSGFTVKIFSTGGAHQWKVNECRMALLLAGTLTP